MTLNFIFPFILGHTLYVNLVLEAEYAIYAILEINARSDGLILYPMNSDTIIPC